MLEPGRAVVGHSGALVSRVVDTKRYPDGRQFAVLDAGMTRADAARALRLVSTASFRVSPRPAAETRVGHRRPDLREQRRVRAAIGCCRRCEVDDLVAVLDAGAYGAVMASNYNRRLLAPEVLVDEGQWRVIRRRQTLDDVLALES